MLKSQKIQHLYAHEVNMNRPFLRIAFHKGDKMHTWRNLLRAIVKKHVKKSPPWSEGLIGYNVSTIP